MTDQEHPAYPGHGPGYAGGPSPAGPGPAGHPAGPGPAGDAPTAPARPVRSYRADSLRGVIFGRGTGWAVAAVLAGAVVALSILLADGTGGPRTDFVVGPPAGAVHQGRLFLPGRQAISVPPGALRPGSQIPAPGFALAPPLSEQCLRIALPSSGQGSASPAPSPPPTATPQPSASPGQSRITIRLPGGHSATCTITVKPG